MGREAGKTMAAGWRQWSKRPEIEQTLVDRALGRLPHMESTKQLARLLAEVYRPGMRLLDVGCNVGHYLRAIREIGRDIPYRGVDAYEHYIETARAIFKGDSMAEFYVKDVLEPLYPEDPSDITFCCNVLLHLPDFRPAVVNLLGGTKAVLIVRTLLGDETTIVKRALGQVFDQAGDPLDYIYQNTWQTAYFVDFVEARGWRVRLIEDQFDAEALNREYRDVKRGRGTRVVGGLQADGNIIFNWMWAIITPTVQDSS